MNSGQHTANILYQGYATTVVYDQVWVRRKDVTGLGFNCSMHRVTASTAKLTPHATSVERRTNGMTHIFPPPHDEDKDPLNPAKELITTRWGSFTTSTVLLRELDSNARDASEAHDQN